jgi:hypothetical protein
MFLAICDVLTAEQQQKIVANLQGLAKLREERGDVIASSFLHALAQDEHPQDTVQPPQKPVLRLVQ